MIQNITRITNTSTIDEINSNFEAIQTAINDKQLAFHYLNLYNLKGSVIAEMNEITRAYNILNLNEALLIVVNPNNNDDTQAGERWRSNITLYPGDYLVKTTAGPLRIPGPTTGYYIPSVNNTGELTYTYRTSAPTVAEQNLAPVNIQGAPGIGYDLTFNLTAGASQSFPKTGGPTPIIQIYHSDTLIDYPYTLELNGATYTLGLHGDWGGEQFTIRVR